MKKSLRIAVIGGLSAGPSAAAKARRTNPTAEIHMFEKGQYISYATCGLPYALSGKIENREKLLVVKPELLETRFNIRVHINEEVLEIDPHNKTLKTPKGEYAFDKLIYAAGARAVWPPIPGFKEASNIRNLRTLEDFDLLHDEGEPGNIAILGGGLIGLEAAENLAMAGWKVTIVEAAPTLLPMMDPEIATMIQHLIEENGIRVVTRKRMESIRLENGRVVAFTLEGGEVCPTQFILVSAGVRPNTELLTVHGAKTLGNGALITNEKGETSLPDIYAAGDCASIYNPIKKEHGYYPLGTHSNKAGRVAGANAAGGSEEFKGGYGTAIIKLFGYTFARTGSGLNDVDLETVESTMIAATSTPGFYPDPKEIFVKLWYEKASGRLIGGQVAGQKGVDKRIDVISTAMFGGLTVEQLQDLDLAYAPPFGPAKDPVIVAGYAAQNHRRGRGVLEPHLNQLPVGMQLIDVRNPAEIQKFGKLKGALEIPLDELEERLGELPEATTYGVYCARGLRGYLASIILDNAGKSSQNLLGGFAVWKGRLEVEKAIFQE